MNISWESKYDRPDDTLVHYGVLGMKWGIRRSKAKIKSASKHKKKSAETDNPEEKAKHIKRSNKALSDSLKIKQRHIDRTDKATYDRVDKTKVRTLLGQSLIGGGSYGALKYNQTLANDKNVTREAAWAKSLLYGGINYGTYGLAGIIAPRVTERDNRKKRNK